jgi:hypothetical protein
MFQKRINNKNTGKLTILVLGFLAALWFLIRVIEKPQRASYPCQRAAFPMASAFVFWLIGLVTFKTAFSKINSRYSQNWAKITIFGGLAVGIFMVYTLTIFSKEIRADESKSETKYDYTPDKSNQPVGTAKGIFPGRVVWAHDPKVTKWNGYWNKESDQYWTDANTNQQRVEKMLEKTVLQLTGTNKLDKAWDKIFKYHNTTVKNLTNTGYKKGEIIAIKPNFNNTYNAVKTDNLTDVSPQILLALVRQLVYIVKVDQKDIVIYDVRRFIPDYVLEKIWKEFKDVRFVQVEAPKESQPKNLAYGNYTGLEAASFVQGVSYSKNKYDKARNIPKQVFDATYLINVCILKAHSYPYNTMEDGDEGQTGISMCGKNHFGSIEGTWELHAAINSNEQGTKNAYSPMVDLAASPNLGAKTILYVMDALYCGRKWKTYPVHFPNPPFNNQTEPYENTHWPSSILASLDGVALDCVGLDIYNSQIPNNSDNQGRSRLLLRENSGDYLLEMAQPENAPSGTKYQQNGKPVKSLGVFEHWDNDLSRKYSRNMNKNGQGIELIYFKQ